MAWWRKSVPREKVDEVAAIALAFQIAFSQLAARHFFQQPTVDAVEGAKREVDYLLTVCIAEAERKLGVGAASAAVTDALNETMLNIKRELEDYARTAC